MAEDKAESLAAAVNLLTLLASDSGKDQFFLPLTLSPHLNRTLITTAYLVSFSLSVKRVRNLVSFVFEMPYPNNALNED